jgi:hypothetical protein
MRTTLSILGAVVVIGVTSGCVQHVHEAPSGPPKVVVKQGGPPPHAPAHGYRRKHAQDGVDMVFDSDLGVYIVVDTPDCWWSDSRYYRWRDGGWTIGAHVSGPWTTVAIDAVPSGLRGYKAKGNNGKGKAKGKGK